MQFNTRPGGPGGMQGGPGGPGGPPGGPYGGGKGGGGGSSGPQDMNQGQGPMGNMGGGPGGPGPNNMNQGGPGGPPGSGQVGGGGGGGGHQEPDWSVKNDASEFEKENDFVQFFKYIQGHHSCTHSSMIGPSDHRIPRSGKFDITKPEALQKLYHAVSFFYRQGKPLVLCEIATSRFRFFEDVDLILTADLKDNVANLQNLWIDHLLRHRAAVLGAVWRSDDPLGVKCRYTYDPENNQTERATVHVFSSSGWSSRHNLPKISLHFVWPNLIVTPREAKGIRSATIEFLRESCSPELSELLKGFQANHLLLQNQQQMNQGGPKAQFPSEDVSPWEEIFDKAATEGTSLRLVWCDKGSKADMNLKSAARLEGRPKLPVGTYSIPLIAGDPSKCIPECTEPPSSKTDVQWLIDASIRLDGSISEIPPVSNVWLSASQTKGLAGIQLSRPNASIAGGGGMMNDGSANDYGPGGMNNGGMNQGGMGAPNNGTNGMGVGMGMNNQMSNGQNGGPDSGEDAFSTIKKELLGKHVDQNSNWMTVEEYNPPVSEKMAVKLDATGAQIAELVISPDVYSMPVDIDYISMDGSGKCYRMSFMPSIDKYGTFFLLNNGNEGENGPYNPSTATIIPMEQGGSSWMWRKPAVPQLDQRTGEVSVWPSWAEFILIEIAGSADSTDKSMGLAAIICAVSNVPTSGKVHGESFWKGHMSFSSKDFVNSEDVPVAVNVPLATVAAVVFGLKAVLDLREKIGGPKIKGIFISSDHTVVEAAVDGGSSTPQYLEAIVKLLSVYKQEILDDDCFPSCYNFAVSKISASSNKAAKLAREARAGALDEEMPGCSMGDIELYDSVISCCEAAAKMGGGGGAKQY